MRVLVERTIKVTVDDATWSALYDTDLEALCDNVTEKLYSWLNEAANNLELSYSGLTVELD